MSLNQDPIKPFYCFKFSPAAIVLLFFYNTRWKFVMMWFCNMLQERVTNVAYCVAHCLQIKLPCVCVCLLAVKIRKNVLLVVVRLCCAGPPCRQQAGDRNEVQLTMLATCQQQADRQATGLGWCQQCSSSSAQIETSCEGIRPMNQPDTSYFIVRPDFPGMIYFQA